VTWQRQESTSTCDSCRAYWNVCQDLGEDWDAAGRPADPEGWGVIIARALTAYLEHLGQHHLPRH
jgi:hypothetical protein